MRVSVEGNGNVSVSVGDILNFSHKGSAGEHGFYLVCKDEAQGYFIMNLSGKKRRIIYYVTLGDLLHTHRHKIEEIYPAKEYQIKLERV